ncbi:MAG: riboflavin biosynthesis protein RibF [Tannerella sp.]|jgi:riboflavin kinase/FMN adenylyltransferase|nr:riboflavin biosynthesis protein RibF [Tannerella sp.]
MEIIYRADSLTEQKLIATVGFFDGVHLGHRFLIDTMCCLGKERGLASVVFTFPVHPRIVLQADYQPKLLNSFEEKMERLATTNADYCIVLDFTLELAAYPASDFLAFLANEWNVQILQVGYDHRFGHNRAEGFDQYVKYGSGLGIEVIHASSFKTERGAVSSSKIRQLLAESKVDEAAELLTYPYRLKGHIISGRQVGRKLGFPTANIQVDEPFKVWPGTGVYAVWVYLCGNRYKGMLSIGSRPTFDDEQQAIEVHLLNFSGTVYQEVIEVEFVHFIREVQKFATIDALKAQLKNDRERVDKILV